MAEHSPTRRTVLIAGAANLFVGVIKLVAGILAGSSAMLAEAAVKKGPGSRAAGVAMAFKLIESAQARWRAVKRLSRVP